MKVTVRCWRLYLRIRSIVAVIVYVSGFLISMHVNVSGKAWNTASSVVSLYSPSNSHLFCKKCDSNDFAYAGNSRNSSIEMCSLCPVIRSKLSSCEITICPSRVHCTSISSISQPSLTALRKAASVFSGCSADPPLCAIAQIFRSRLSRFGL